MSRLLAALLLLLSTVPVRAQSQPDPDFERVLVPVFYFGGGANGSQWWTDVSILNAGPTFRLANELIQGDPGCPALCGCDAQDEVEQNDVETICPTFEGVEGVILHVPRGIDRDQVHMAARGRDQSRSADRYGAEIPVVWERDLLAGPMVLLDIPTDDRYRVALRLFDAFQYDTRFTLRFFDMAELRRGRHIPLFETSVTAQWDPASDLPVYRGRPAFAFIGDLAAAFPVLRNAQSVAIEITGSDPLITPVPPSNRYWALASITNNTTQEFAVVSPR